MTTKLLQGNCLYHLKDLPDNSIDLIVTDPPYLIENTKAGGHSELAKSIQKMNDEIQEEDLTEGYEPEILDEMVRVMKNINCYIWCNGKQIPAYFDYFVNKLGCAFDIIIWNKTNATPLFNNKYLTDKEYCLYFRKGGYCCPPDYESAKTVYYQPINIKDKNLWHHPTIKPLNIIINLIKNSSKKGDTVCDPFMGSGTTGVAAAMLDRNFIGMEKSEKHFHTSQVRISSTTTLNNVDPNNQQQLTLFD